MEQHNDSANVSQPFNEKPNKGYVNIIITVAITLIVAIGGMLIYQQIINKNKIENKLVENVINQNIPVNNELANNGIENNNIIFYTKIFQDRAEDNLIDNITEVYAINLTTNENKLIYSTKESYDNSVFNFQSANGILTFVNNKHSKDQNNKVIQNKNILFWDGKELTTIYHEDSLGLPNYDYKLHPSGEYVIVISNYDSKAYNLDSENHKDYYSENKFIFYKIPLQDPSVNKVYEEILTTNDYDSFVEYVVTGWTKETEPRLLLEKMVAGQLGSYINDVFTFNPQNNSLEKVITNLQPLPLEDIQHDIFPIDRN